VKQDLELETLLALISDIDDSLQTLFCQGNRIHNPEIIWPSTLRRFRESSAVEAEIELNAVVCALNSIALRSRLAEKFPACVAGEAMLWERGGGMVLRWWTEDLVMRYN
jgi:hypothetical protein